MLGLLLGAQAESPNPESLKEKPKPKAEPSQPSHSQASWREEPRSPGAPGRFESGPQGHGRPRSGEPQRETNGAIE